MPVAKIIIYTKEPESEQLLIDTVTRHYKDVVTVSSSSDIAKYIKLGDTKVVMVSTDSFKNSLAIYYHALSFISDNEMLEHAFVPLVSRHDEKQAWEAFNAGFADDYIVSRPLYEPHRPIMVCDNLLKQMGIAKQTTGGEELKAQINKMPERIRDVINSGMARKDNLQKEFNQTISIVDRALDKAADRIQQNQTVKLDMEQLQATLSSIRSDEIRPELLKLQGKAISLLEKMFTDLNAEVQSEITETKKAPPKPTQFNNLYQEKLDAEATKTPTIPKVLVVDDDSVSLSVTMKAFEPYLMRVETASLGRRALATLNSQAFDLLIIDINLSDCNGLFAINQLANSDSKNKNIPKVVLTSNRDKQSIKTASEMGASEYLLKPLKKETLIKLCKKYDISIMKKK